MTAPVVAPAAPLGAPATSNSTISQDAVALINSDDSTFMEAFGVTLPPATQARDESGKFSGEKEPLIEVIGKTEGDIPAEGEGGVETPAETPSPEGEVKAEEPPVEPTRALVTAFKVFDPTGKEQGLGTLADMVVEYKADGEVRRDTLDKVVRMAQTGKYNERLHADLDTMREELPLARNAYDELLHSYQKLDQKFTSVIENDDLLLKERERYIQDNSPEAVLARRQAELNRREAELNNGRASMAMQGFIQQDIEPAIASYLEKYPNVSEDEVLARFHRGVQQFARRGVVPPENLPKVRDFVVRELGEFAAHLHDKRETDKAAASVNTQREVLRAKEEAAAAKRTLARAQLPSSGPARRDGSAARPIVNVDDAVNDIMAGLSTR